MTLDSYGIDQGSWVAVPFTADGGEDRLPFAAFRSQDPDVALDPARPRALIVSLDGEPGGREWIELENMRFYR